MKAIRSFRFQQGMSMWEISFVLLMVGFLLTIVMTLGPHYIDDMTVSSALKDLHKEFAGKDVYELKNSDIKARLGKTFQVNTVSNQIEQAVEITRDGGSVLVTINYEIREEFMGNVDVVLKFEHQEDLSRPISE